MGALFLIVLVLTVATTIILIVFSDKEGAEEEKEEITEKRPEIAIGAVVDVFQNRRSKNEKHTGRGVIISRGFFRARVRFDNGEESCEPIEALALVSRLSAEKFLPRAS